MKESKNAVKPSFIYRDGMIADKEYDITGFSLTNVQYMKRWYLFYNERDAKSQRLVDQMSPQVGDTLLRGEGDNPSVGLLICKSTDKTIVEWSLQDIQKPLGVASYQLQEVVERTIAELENMKKNDDEEV